MAKAVAVPPAKLPTPATASTVVTMPAWVGANCTVIVQDRPWGRKVLVKLEQLPPVMVNAADLPSE
jgi:hypothetical protein